MSKCISREGEYSDHDLAERPRFMCSRCFAFDEDAAVNALEAAEARIKELETGEWEYLCQAYNDKGELRIERICENEEMRDNWTAIMKSHECERVYARRRKAGGWEPWLPVESEGE